MKYVVGEVNGGYTMEKPACKAAKLMYEIGFIFINQGFVCGANKNVVTNFGLVKY